jgi:hypothetical protein
MGYQPIVVTGCEMYPMPCASKKREIELPLLEFSDTRVITATTAFQIIVEDPDGSVLEADADVAESAGHVRTALFDHYTPAPAQIPLVEYLIANLEIEGVSLSHAV